MLDRSQVIPSAAQRSRDTRNIAPASSGWHVEGVQIPSQLNAKLSESSSSRRTSREYRP